MSVANQCMQPTPCEQLCAVVRTGVEQCFCEQGFRLEGNNRDCSGKINTVLVPLGYIPLLSFHSSDINECASNNGNCEQLCNNTKGSFTCSCQLGYILNADQRTCDG